VISAYRSIRRCPSVTGKYRISTHDFLASNKVRPKWRPLYLTWPGLLGVAVARYSTVSDLVRRLENSAKSDLGLAHLAVAVAFAVIGEVEKVGPLLEALEEMASQQPPLVARQTTHFLAAFRAYFDGPA
jgi:hypothetical protein